MPLLDIVSIYVKPGGNRRSVPRASCCDRVGGIGSEVMTQDLGDRDISDLDHDPEHAHRIAVAHASGLVRELIDGESSIVVELAGGPALVSNALEDLAGNNHGRELTLGDVDPSDARGVFACRCDLSDVSAVCATLDEHVNVGGIMLLDALERLLQPQELLTALSQWAVKHNRPTLVVSVSNVSHFDVALRLLCGRWIPTSAGLLDTTHLRYFTEETLTHLVRRTGWEIVARDDVSTHRSDQYDANLAEAVPIEMMDAVRLLSDSQNPDAAVERFVWALRPVAVADPPGTYLDAVAPSPAQMLNAAARDRSAVNRYLASAGILADEAARRAAASGSGPLADPPGPGRREVLRSYLKQVAISQTTKSPVRKRTIRRIYGWYR